MAHLGEQAITAERIHDHDDRLLYGVNVTSLNDHDLALALRQMSDRLFVADHWNARLLAEAAYRLEALHG